ncbi:MAG: hypothetical protein GX342_04835 [Alcaligenaceae bacterium]|nr:hypothetical protein [Alcaligenaceae bacterium]
MNSDAIKLTKSSLLLNDDVSLEFKDFKEFYEARRTALKLRLANRVSMTDAMSIEMSMEDNDEELIEDTELL